jgi:NADH:ubiquinone oxidoreductase subunit 5 (subunit L)/multisubunit Na+/H+ antiporter MnhA subunit
MKRLLGYHAVSQVGYMVLGIGTGNPIGIAGGIFHMLNNSVYKQALFLISGNVEQKKGTTDLDKLGGLSKTMPLTYITALIASLSISGVPPFNGFVSKWMVYQGIIQNVTKSPSHQVTSIICLVAAMFGSGLTLASFMKLIHATFLGQPTNQRTNEPTNEVSWTMWLPPVILAIVCMVFGVFANQIPLKYFILPAVTDVSFMGTWYAGLASLLIVIGLVLGIIIFKLKGLRPSLREDKAFVGAEVKDLEGASVTGTEFYNTIKELGILKGIYKKAGKGFFDIYEQGKRLVFSISGLLQRLHNGILPTYLVWGLLGMLGLFFLMNR